MSTRDAPVPSMPAEAGIAGARLLIARAPYYRDVVEGLTLGARLTIEQAGATHETIDVAGALELAPAIRLAARMARGFDAFVALGCVVRGETDHYEHVCREAMAGLTFVALQFGLIVGNGMLTVRDVDQARARSGRELHNKGAEAAVAALSLLRAARALGGS